MKSIILSFGYTVSLANGCASKSLYAQWVGTAVSVRSLMTSHNWHFYPTVTYGRSSNLLCGKSNSFCIQLESLNLESHDSATLQYTNNLFNRIEQSYDDPQLLLYIL